jgi:hypothetical protein
MTWDFRRVSDTEGTTPPVPDVPVPGLRPRGDRRHEAPETAVSSSVPVDATDVPNDGPATEAMSVQDRADVDNDGPATEAMSVQDRADVDNDGPATEAMSVQDVADVDDDGPSTEAMSVEDVAAARAVKEPLTEVFPRGGPPPGAARGTGSTGDADGGTGTDDGSAIDSLFRDDQFHEQDDPGILPQLPPTLTNAARKPTSGEPRAPLTRNQKTMLWSAAGLIVVLFLIALYLLSFRVGEQSATREAAAAVPAATSQPVAPADAVGPVDPGKYAWDELLGAECIDPFESAWDTEFTVVDCEDEHVAQMLTRAEIETDTPFPGVEPLASQISTLCSAPTVLNFDAAGVVSDIQLTASFPADSAEWDAGNRTYYCFVTRASGEPLPGDLAIGA